MMAQTRLFNDREAYMAIKAIAMDIDGTLTNDQKVIRFYVKSLYIYKDQFLIGERTAPKLRGPNYFPVRLSDISRIEFNSF